MKGEAEERWMQLAEQAAQRARPEEIVKAR
jgi:hypothetical protein